MNSKNLIEKFIYSCSHDLRSPVASIQGLVRIAEYYPRHDEIHKCLEMIEACTQKMDKMISGLQEFLTNNLHEISTEPVDPKELVEAVVTDFKTQLDVAKIEITSLTNSEVTGFTDRYRISRILTQLISNAIAFHDPAKSDRKIFIRMESDSQGALLEVTDNGLGIPENQQARVFEVFHRCTENTIGLGMGLFIVKSLTEQLGGTIACISEVNIGSTFLVRLPSNVLINV